MGQDDGATGGGGRGLSSRPGEDSRLCPVKQDSYLEQQDQRDSNADEEKSVGLGSVFVKEN